MKFLPFSESVEWFVPSFGNNGNLTAADSVYEASAFDNGFGSDENEVHLVHHIRNSRIKYYRARDSSSSKFFACFNAGMTQGAREVRTR